MRNFLFILLGLLITVAGLETATRLLGHYPFNYNMAGDKISDVIVIKPESYLKKDTLIGYSLKSGSYQTIYSSGFSFFSTHDKFEHRISQDEIANADNLPRKRIHIYGDSYFYGFGINDTSTFAWKLQQELPQQQVVNRAIMGHSAVSSLLLLNNDIQNGRPPDVAVILFTENDLNRCVFSKDMERNISVHKSAVSDYTYPYARLTDKGLTIGYKPLSSTTYRLSRYSAFYNLLETAYFNYERKKLHPEQVYQAVFDTLLLTCKQHGVLPVIACVSKGSFALQMRSYYEKQGNPFVYFGDLLEDKYTLLPYDRHPNSWAHTIYAQRIMPVIDSLLRTNP